MKTRNTLVHPEDSNSIVYWTRKWGISSRQLIDAILHTGSVNPVRLKEYLKKDIWYYTPLLALLRFFGIRRNNL